MEDIYFEEPDMKTAIYETEMAFRSVFHKGDYETAKLLFEAVEMLKQADENLHESTRVRVINHLDADSLALIEKSIEELNKARIILSKSVNYS